MVHLAKSCKGHGLQSSRPWGYTVICLLLGLIFLMIHLSALSGQATYEHIHWGQICKQQSSVRLDKPVYLNKINSNKRLNSFATIMYNVSEIHLFCKTSLQLSLIDHRILIKLQKFLRSATACIIIKLI